MKEGKHRVAIIGTQGIPAHYGGFETLVENLVKNNSGKVSYTVYCSKLDLPTHYDSYQGAVLKYVPLHSHGMQSILYDLWSVLKAIGHCDTILMLGVSGCMFLPLLKLLTSAKFIVNIDGMEHRRAKWNSLARQYLLLSTRVAIKFADTVISDNFAIQAYVSNNYERYSELIAYGGDQVLVDVPEEEQTAYLTEIGLCKNQYALTICRIEKENNVGMILDAFADSRKKIAVVGNFGVSDYSRRLREKYSKYSNIILLDSIYDMRKLFILRNNTALYVHGHSSGGTNPSLVEAMFFGRPIVAYDVCYNRATTSDLADYFTCKESLMDLLDEELSNGQSLKQLAIKRYRWEVIAGQYETLY